MNPGRRVFRAILLVGLSASCAHAQNRQAAPRTAACTGGCPAAAGTGGIADTESDLFPDPRDRTWLRLKGLYPFVMDYLREHGSLPDRIEQFMPAQGTQYVDFHDDAWGHALRYVRRGHEYEIRSAGPDGELNTPDDLVETRTVDPAAGDRSLRSGSTG
jgi:hypothetical protein